MWIDELAQNASDRENLIGGFICSKNLQTKRIDLLEDFNGQPFFSVDVKNRKSRRVTKQLAFADYEIRNSNLIWEEKDIDYKWAEYLCSFMTPEETTRYMDGFCAYQKQKEQNQKSISL